MEGLLGTMLRISKFMRIIAGISLTFIMLLTVADVVLRAFGRPIMGTYEIVALSGAVVIAFVLPLTSWQRHHVNVDFLVQRLPDYRKNVVNIVTRCVGIALFLLVGWNTIKIGTTFLEAGETTLTLQLPTYPIAYGVGICCFVESLVLFCDILKILRGEYE